MNKPMVSIVIPNYNYGKYLANCLDSVIGQTYENIEVLFRDNASSDESFEIAMDYVKRFKERGIPFMIANNRYNYGSDLNSFRLLNEAGGKYVYTLSSDDAIAPDFISRTVKVMEEHSTVAMVMTHRVDVNENGEETRMPPFYNCDCIVDGDSQAGVFMMAGIAVPSQRIGNSSLARKINGFTRVHNVAGDWYNNFLYACCGDVAYLTEPLCYYRVHTGNETSESEDRLVGTFEHYLLLDSFVKIADAFGMKKPQQRYPDAVKKLGSMCLRYALKMYQNDKKEIARKYLDLSVVYHSEITEKEEYKKLYALQQLTGDEYAGALAEYQQQYCLERTASYDPPEGYIPL